MRDAGRGYCLPRLAHRDAKTKGIVDAADVCVGGNSGSKRWKTGSRRNATQEATKVKGHADRNIMWPGGVVDGDKAMNDLYTKLAHVQWRKHANDKSIRRAIDTSKRMHERDLLVQLAVDRERERERWTEAIVRDELARPAEISETFLKEWEQHEEKDRSRQLKETKLHLSSVRRVERKMNAKRLASTPPAGHSCDQGRNDSGGSSIESEPRQEIPEASGISAAEKTTTGTTYHDGENVLKAKVKSLKSEIKERGRELRRAARNADARGYGAFSAKSFKTGRGRL